MYETPRALIDNWLVTIYDPSTISANFHSLEVAFILGFVLTLRHALCERKRGNLGGLVLWLTALMYGIWMELLTYNTIDNFTHAQFTIQFYYKQLPFYVILLYPTFIYAAVLAARRLKVGPVATFFTAGLLAVMIDIPFDIMGPDCGWWWWHEGGEDPYGLVGHRWLGVPVSSYCWHLLFNGSQGSVTSRFSEGLQARLGGRGLLATLAGLTPATMILGALGLLMGVVVMMPFHAFRAVGFTDGVFTATLLVVASLVMLLSSNRPNTEPAARGVLLWVLLWYIYNLILGCVVWSGGEVPNWELKAMVIGFVAIVAMRAHTWIHLRRN